jgi:hypothetical protein
MKGSFVSSFLTKSRLESHTARDAVDKEHRGRGVNESACRVDGGLKVLCQPSIAADPSEELHVIRLVMRIPVNVSDAAVPIA